MTTRVFVIFAITLLAPCHSSPDDVDDFNRLSSSLSQQISSGVAQQISTSDIKITDEKHIKKIEFKSQGTEQSSQLSHYSHRGNNLFFKPQIVVGTSLGDTFVSKPEVDINKKEVTELPATTSKVDDVTNDKEEIETLSDVPEAPILPPLIMPSLPETVIIEEVTTKPACIDHSIFEETIIESKPVVIPEPPAFLPLNPPIIDIIMPKPVPHVSTCIELSHPCPPLVAVSPDIVSFGKVVAEKTVIIPEVAPLPLPLPKIPLGVVYNKPVKTVVPYGDGFISSTRFLPSVKVSKISLNAFDRHQIFEIPSRPSEIVIEKKVFNQVVPLTSFSAFCAHNIALERVVPNIVEGREIINVAPVRPVLEVPVRPFY